MLRDLGFEKEAIAPVIQNIARGIATAGKTVDRSATKLLTRGHALRTSKAARKAFGANVPYSARRSALQAAKSQAAKSKKILYAGTGAAAAGAVGGSIFKSANVFKTIDRGAQAVGKKILPNWRAKKILQMENMQRAQKGMFPHEMNASNLAKAKDYALKHKGDNRLFGYGVLGTGTLAVGGTAAGIGAGMKKKAKIKETAQAVDKTMMSLGKKLLAKSRTRRGLRKANKDFPGLGVNAQPDASQAQAIATKGKGHIADRIVGYGVPGAALATTAGGSAYVMNKKAGKVKKIKDVHAKLEKAIGNYAKDDKAVYSLATGIVVGGGSSSAGHQISKKKKMQKKASKVGGIKGSSKLDDKKLINVAQDALKELGRPVHTDDHVDVSSPATHDPTYLGYFAKDKANTDKKIGHIGTSPDLGALGFLHREKA